MITEFLKTMSSHTRFLDTSTYPCIPWALIHPLEKLISGVVPNAQFVFRAKWNWNYTILDISRFYRDSLIGSGLDVLVDIKQLFGSQPSWCIVSLPRVDRGNMLLHTILAHEAGHRIVDRYLASEDQAAVQREIAQLVGDCKWRVPDIETMKPAIQFHLKGQTYGQLQGMRSQAIKELGSDLAGFYLFGPSFLFALAEGLLDDALDALPQEPQFYPPSRMRFRAIVDALKGSGFPAAIASLADTDVETKVAAAFDSRVGELAALVAIDTDRQAISHDEAAIRAYAMVDKVMPNVRTFVREQVGQLAYENLMQPSVVKELLGKLALGVPPFGAGARFQDAILAGCLYQLSELPVPHSRATRNTDTTDVEVIHRLVHKAVEYCDIQEEYKVGS